MSLLGFSPIWGGQPTLAITFPGFEIELIVSLPRFLALDHIWWKFDDDKVSQVTQDEILRLDGGGDWHMAYICLYQSKPNIK